MPVEHFRFRKGTLLCYSLFTFLTITSLYRAVDAWTICFSPDSRFLASGSQTGKINLFGVDSGKKESSLDTRGKFTLSIAYVRSFFLSSQDNGVFIRKNIATFCSYIRCFILTKRYINIVIHGITC